MSLSLTLTKTFLEFQAPALTLVSNPDHNPDPDQNPDPELQTSNKILEHLHCAMAEALTCQLHRLLCGCFPPAGHRGVDGARACDEASTWQSVFAQSG